MKNLITLHFFLLLFSLSLNAQTIYVNKAATGNNDGSSWANAYTDLQAGLDAAATDANIWVANGTYTRGDKSKYYTFSKKMNLYGGFSGSENSLDERVIENNLTILSADHNGDDASGDLVANRSDNSLHVMRIMESANDGLIDGFTISGGHANQEDDISSIDNNGGGIHSIARSFTINNCKFIDNRAAYGGGFYVPKNSVKGTSFNDCTFDNNEGSEIGGAIFAGGFNTIAEVNNSAFTNNTSEFGGGIYSGNEGSKLTVINSTFTTNISTSTGGALHAAWSAELVVTDCTFDSNIADGFGGAIIAQNRNTKCSITNSDFMKNETEGGFPRGQGGAVFVRDFADLNVSNSNFLNNIVRTGGSGIYIFESAKAVIDQCLFKGNDSGTSGAGLEASQGGLATITNSDFEENIARRGAAIYIWGGANTTITDTKFIKNTASLIAGAIRFRDTGGEINRINNCEFDENTGTDNGGAIHTEEAKLEILNTTFTKNKANFGGAISAIKEDNEVIISNSEFSNNEAITDGGALESFDGTYYEIKNTNFYNNLVTNGNGGAIELGVSETGRPNLIDACIFDGNKAIRLDWDGAGFGGAINLINSHTAITNSLFINNQSTAGGTIKFNNDAGSPFNSTLLNSTFAKNNNENVGTLLSKDNIGDKHIKIELQNNIFADSEEVLSIEAGEPDINSLGGNLIANNNSANLFNHSKDQNNIDPKFKNTDSDFRLSNDSPAIHGGVNANAPTIDLVGFDRDDFVDIGAYESQEIVPVLNTLVEAGKFNIFPNPVNNLLQYQLENDWKGDFEIQILDTSGKTIWQRVGSKATQSIQAEISTLDLLSGTYFLRLSANGEQHTKLFIKQ